MTERLGSGEMLFFAADRFCKSLFTVHLRPHGYGEDAREAAGERMRMDIGNQIREHRQRLELSQDELAQKLYVSRITVSHWETGVRQNDLTGFYPATIL